MDFQKLLFLYCQEHSSLNLYDFVPYRFGAFSFSSYADRRKLVERGFLVDDEQQWRLTETGHRTADAMLDSDITGFTSRYSSLRGDALVAETYRRFPYYAIHSEIAGRVLHGDEETIARIESERATDTAPGLFTIGYEGYTIESYLNTLIRSGVTILCDVRRNPVSRKYGFSKSTLSKGCMGVSIGYLHFPGLGIASEKRRGISSQADYDALFSEYERDTLPGQAVTLAEMIELIVRGGRIALTCYEKLPHQCHRLRVAEALMCRSGYLTTVVHL